MTTALKRAAQTLVPLAAAGITWTIGYPAIAVAAICFILALAAACWVINSNERSERLARIILARQGNPKCLQASPQPEQRPARGRTTLGHPTTPPSGHSSSQPTAKPTPTSAGGAPLRSVVPAYPLSKQESEVRNTSSTTQSQKKIKIKNAGGTRKPPRKAPRAPGFPCSPLQPPSCLPRDRQQAGPGSTTRGLPPRRDRNPPGAIRAVTVTGEPPARGLCP